MQSLKAEAETVLRGRCWGLGPGPDPGSRMGEVVEFGAYCEDKVNKCCLYLGVQEEGEDLGGEGMDGGKEKSQGQLHGFWPELE